MKPAEKPLVNIRMLMRIIGLLLAIEAVFMLFPTLTCIIYDEADVWSFGLTAAGTFLAGVMLSVFSRPRVSHMGKRDSFLLTSMVWVFYSAFGMLPFIFCTTPMSVSDSFFEAMSGFTTTGASTFASINYMSHGVQLWRAMMQWIGGMGIILFTLAVFPMLNHSGGLQMFNAEVTGITHDKIRPRISQTAKALWYIYIGLTFILVMLLWAGPMDFFEAICHSFGTISTGGFSTEGNSIAAYDSVYIKVVITVFMFLGGVSFALMYRALCGNWKELRRNDVLRTYIMLIAFFFLVFVICIISRNEVHSWQDLTINPLFQIISTMTSTGFSATNYESWGPFVIALMFFMMFFGACAGSTAGGAKIDRLLYLVKNCRNEIYRSLYPHSILPVRINGKVVSPELVNKVIAFLCIYVALIFIGGLVLTALGMPLVDSFFSVLSCMSNIGLGAGMTGYGSSFEVVPDAAKWVMSLLMLTGRLEVFTVLLLFTRAFWRK